MEKKFPVDFWPLWALIKAVILPFQGNSRLPNIWQQTEHLSHEYKLDDKTLQKAQLEQYKIFQNFPSSPALAAPNAPPLLAGMNPKISPLLEPKVKASAWNAKDPGLIPELGSSLEEEMATHSSTLAWRIPWREEPGRLQSMGSQRAGHDWTTSLHFTNDSDNDSPETLFDTKTGNTFLDNNDNTDS